MMRKLVLLSMLVAGFAAQALAQQIRPRPEDHFWRRKVVNRIDLEEKVNQPLVKLESKYYRSNPDEDEVYPEKDGLVSALFRGLKSGAYTALDPDTLTKVLTWEDVIDKINKIEAEGAADAGLEADAGMPEGDGGFDTFEGDAEEDPFASDSDFEDPFGPPPGGDPFATGDDMSGGMGGDSELASEDGTDGASAASAAPDPGNDFPSMLPFERVIHFVEDRIFDKNRSDIVHDIQFIEIVWVDPNETLPERVLCTFRYEDVVETLAATQWKNRFNDAEYKNMREVFELRMFHSYIINLSGEGIVTLDEAEYRRQQLVEFEHHLWSY
jgi:hypothetical protein